VLRWTAGTLLLAGTVLVGNVGYQLYGTGLVTAQAQASLRTELARGYPDRPRGGEAVGFIRIPRLSLDAAFVEGVDDHLLERGPGHYPHTPLPGEAGNVAIAGHRTTHAAPFWALDTLVPGDHVTLETAAGEFVYRVLWTRVVSAAAVWVVGPTVRPTLTLTTCNPRFRGIERLVVRAEQIYGATPSGFMDRRARGLGLGGEWFGSASDS
jgi:sortase A